MYLYSIILPVILVFQAHGHTDDKNCKLKVVDKYKDEFENEILNYLDKESKTMILEYELDFSNVGPDFDLINRSNPKAVEPWRWYRTKGIASILFFNKNNLFAKIMNLMNKKITVYLTDTPAGCLYNISEDLETHISDFLLRDFDIPVNDLRTTVELSIDAAICTTHNDSLQLFFWCCEYEIHRRINCYKVEKNFFFQYGKFFFFLVSSIASLYLPLLLPVTKKKRKGNLHFLPGEDKKFIGLIKKDSICKEEKNKSISQKSVKKLQTLFKSLDSKEKDKIYSAEIENITLKVDEDNYVHCNETLISGIGSFIYIFFYFFILSVDRHSKRYKIIMRILLCLIFICTPNILTLFLVQDMTTYYVPFGVIGLAQVIIIILLVYDAATKDNFQKGLLNLQKDMNESWKRTYTIMKKICRVCLCWVFFLFPLILCLFLISLTLVFKSPVVFIFWYILPLKTIHSFCHLVISILFYAFMSFSILITDFLITFVALLMFYKPFCITILSGVAVFFVYLRTFVTNVSKEVDENLRDIVDIIQNENVLPTINDNALLERVQNELPETNESFVCARLTLIDFFLPTLHEDVLSTKSNEAKKYTVIFLPIETEEHKKVNFEVVKNCLYVTYKACIPFILKKDNICVSKRLLIQMMSLYFFKILTHSLVAIFFLANIVVVVIGFSIYDYISTVHQVLITLITGILPLVVKMVSEGGRKDSENLRTKKDINEIKRALAEKIKSYEEQVEIADLDLKNWKKDESYSVDLVIESSVESSVESSERINREGYQLV